MKQKCIHCDGLGYFYNQSTFQSENCPHCGGTGFIETVSHDLGGPIETPIDVPEMPLVVEAPVEEPVVEAPKPKKSAKAKPVVDEPTVEPQSDEIATDGQPE